LARLVGGSALSTLVLEGEIAPLLDEPAAVLLGNVLRANTTLTSVTFNLVALFSNAAAATALMDALTAHATIQKLDFSNNFSLFDDAPASLVAAGAVLGALVAANAPALRELNLDACDLPDAGLGPLVDALAANTHLRVLNCRMNQLSEAFERDQLLPALGANPWLQATV
jgi:hypothetical protein